MRFKVQTTCETDKCSGVQPRSVRDIPAALKVAPSGIVIEDNALGEGDGMRQDIKRRLRKLEEAHGGHQTTEPDDDAVRNWKLETMQPAHVSLWLHTDTAPQRRQTSCCLIPRRGVLRRPRPASRISSLAQVYPTPHDDQPEGG
jgi:hypothetical protein